MVFEQIVFNEKFIFIMVYVISIEDFSTYSKLQEHYVLEVEEDPN